MIKETMADAEARMKKTIESLHRDLNTVRTGRASPALLDNVSVDYYGTATPLIQIASVSAPEARMLVIQPWDKGAIGSIEKALQKSELGINPTNDGQVIRISIPQLTEDRRKQMVKIVHNYVEDSRVSVRNVRRDGMTQVRDLTHEKLISEDDQRRAEQQLDELTKKYVDDAEKIGKAKENEVMEV